MSESDVCDHMWQHHDTRIGTGTIHRWLIEYSDLLGGFLATLSPSIKGNEHADEVIVDVKGRKCWRWGAIDSKTKYKISGPLTTRRSYEKGAKPLYYKMRHRCTGLPPKIVSDRLEHYRKAFNKYFINTGVNIVHGVPIACRKYGLEHNNNQAERDNGRVKQRIKAMRGFKSTEGANSFLDMHDVHHNFIKPSMALGGGYPAEEAGIDLGLGRNRLLSLITLAA